MDKELGRAVVLASRDRYAEAMTVLERAIQAYGDAPDLWLCGAYRDLAEAAAMIGQTDKGLATARKAHDMLARIGVGAEQHPITIQREAARTYSMLALNHFLRGERQETYEALEHCRLAGFFYRPGETYQWGSMVEASDADGTRSILDLQTVGDEPDFCVACRIADELLLDLYDTTQPTHEMIERNMGFLEDLERGHGIYSVVYKIGQPDELFFAGYSFD